MILLVMAFLSCTKAEMTATFPPQAPEFTLEDINGNEISLSGLSGKVIFMNFWATWCGPCKVEIPDFIEAYEQHKDKGLVILGVSVDGSGPDIVRQFAREWKINYPIVMVTQKLIRDYRPGNAIPLTLVIDPSGKIRHRKLGPMSRASIEDWFKKLMEE